MLAILTGGSGVAVACPVWWIPLRGEGWFWFWIPLVEEEVGGGKCQVAFLEGRPCIAFSWFFFGFHVFVAVLALVS